MTFINGHEYILVAIDYFIIWMEAASYATLTSKQVKHFIITNIICLYGESYELRSNHKFHFNVQALKLL